MKIIELGISKPSEFKMQDDMRKLLYSSEELIYPRGAHNWHNSYIQPIAFASEVHVPEIKRRADFLLVRKDKLVNVEAKVEINTILVEQLNDHAGYCDYCYALISNFTLTPSWFKKELLSKGYGLLVHNSSTGVVTEALEAHYNKGRDVKLRDAYRNVVRHRFKTMSENVYSENGKYIINQQSLEF